MAKRETMTSRERVLKALNHETPDRVPIDLGGNQTGIHKNAYRNLIAHLGMMRSASQKQFPISNVSDWLPAPAFQRMIELIAKMSAKPARLVWRDLYRNYPIPEGCRAGIRLDERVGTVLATRDRFPLYGVVLAEIHDIPGGPQTEASHAR